MFAILVILHLISAAVLIMVVLLQSGKAGDLASTFGGATSQAAFGARGSATVLTRATTICAVLFMFTSLGLSIMYSTGGSSTVMDEVAVPAATTTTEQTAPAAPETPAQDTAQPAGDTNTDNGESNQ